MTPKEWDQVLRPEVPTNHAKKVIDAQARAFLDGLGEGIQVSTNALVEALYPRSVAARTLEGDVARVRLYALLAKLAPDEMHDCCTKGEPDGSKFMGKLRRPWLWSKPKERETCVCCGQLMPEM